jgi:hypothetical protein
MRGTWGVSQHRGETAPFYGPAGLQQNPHRFARGNPLDQGPLPDPARSLRRARNLFLSVAVSAQDSGASHLSFWHLRADPIRRPASVARRDVEPCSAEGRNRRPARRACCSEDAAGGSGARAQRAGQGGDRLGCHAAEPCRQEGEVGAAAGCACAPHLRRGDGAAPRRAAEGRRQGAEGRQGHRRQEQEPAALSEPRLASPRRFFCRRRAVHPKTRTGAALRPEWRQ